LNRIPGLVESICEAAGEAIEKGTPLEDHRLVSWRVILSGKAVKDAGKLKGFYSRRINIHHRIIYSVDKDRHVVHGLRVWTQ